MWSLEASVTLNSSTQYLFYTDNINNTRRANTTGAYPYGIAHYSLGANQNCYLRHALKLSSPPAQPASPKPHRR